MLCVVKIFFLVLGFVELICGFIVFTTFQNISALFLYFYFYFILLYNTV